MNGNFKKQNFNEEEMETSKLGDFFEEDVFGKEEIILTAEVLDRLFNEWGANGKTDLTIDENIADRIKRYLEYQENLDVLRKKLAKRIYTPYIIYTLKHLKRYMCKLICNNDFKGYFYVWYDKDMQKCVIDLENFKTLLRALKVPGVKWIENIGVYVDYISYLKDNGYKYEYDISYGYEDNHNYLSIKKA